MLVQPFAMQYEFAEPTNRVFSRARSALLVLAVLSLIHLVFILSFHVFQAPDLGRIGALRLVGNLARFLAMISVLLQSVSAAKGLRSIVSTSGGDVSTYILTLRPIRNVLAAIAVLVVIDVVFDFFNHPSFAACLKLS